MTNNGKVTFTAKITRKDGTVEIVKADARIEIKEGK